MHSGGIFPDVSGQVGYFFDHWLGSGNTCSKKVTKASGETLIF